MHGKENSSKVNKCIYNTFYLKEIVILVQRVSNIFFVSNMKSYDKLSIEYSLVLLKIRCIKIAAFVP